MDDPKELWDAYLADRSVTARNRLAESYLPLLQSLARRLCEKLPTHAAQETGDLMGYGFPGLVHAIERFDPARGFKFSTFASQRIVGAMRDGLRGEDWVPRLVRQQERDGEVQVPGMSTAGLGPVAAGEESRDAASLLEQQSACQPAEGMQQEFRDTLHLLCRGLDKVDRLIVLLYHVEGLTMREIGQSLGFSESRVSQRHSQIIQRLRERGFQDGQRIFAGSNVATGRGRYSGMRSRSLARARRVIAVRPGDSVVRAAGDSGTDGRNASQSATGASGKAIGDRCKSNSGTVAADGAWPGGKSLDKPRREFMSKLIKLMKETTADQVRAEIADKQSEIEALQVVLDALLKRSATPDASPGSPVQSGKRGRQKNGPTHEERVANYLRESGPARAEVIAAGCGMPLDSVRATLSRCFRRVQRGVYALRDA